MPAIEHEYTWREELGLLSRAVLDDLGVPHTRSHLSDVVELEESYAFAARDQPPSSRPYPYRRRPHDPFLQLDALTHVLRAFGVKVELYDLDPEELGPDDAPCLAVLRDPDPHEPATVHLVRSISSDAFQGVAPTGEEHRWPRRELGGIWSGIVGLCRADPDSGEEEYARHREGEILARASTIVAIAVVGAATLWSVAGLAAGGTLVGVVGAAVLSVKGVGLAASLQLKRVESTGWYRNAVLERFCRLGEGFNCQRLLSSAGAKIRGLVSWSDVGSAYFLGSLALVLLAGLAPALTAPLLGTVAVLALLTLPFTLYSVFYQGAVARTWCMLCLTVQLLLWVDAALFFALLRLGALSRPDGTTLLLSVAVLAASAGCVHLAHRSARSSTDARVWRLRTLSLLRSPPAVIGLLEHGFRVESDSLAGDLVWADGGETVDLLAVLDPECPFCARAYRELPRLRDRTGGRIRLRVRLVSEGTRLPTMRDIVGLVVGGREGEARRLLGLWFDEVRRIRETGATTDTGHIPPERYARWREEVDFPGYDVASGAHRDAVADQRAWRSTVYFEKFPNFFVEGHYWPATVPYDPYLEELFEEIEAWAGMAGEP